MNEITKICKQCKEEKPSAEFHKHKTGKFGVISNCKCCVAAKKAIYNVEHKEEKATKNAIWYAENSVEVAAKKAIYYQKNREEIAAKKPIYNAKPEIAAKRAIWYAENSVEVAAKKAEWYLNEVRNGIPSELQNSSLDVYWNSYTNESTEPVYKIGVGVNAEYRNKNNKPLNENTEHQNLLTVTYQDRRDGFIVETWFKNTFKAHKYIGSKVLSSGNSELFNTDLFTLYGINLINDNIFFYVQDGVINTPLNKNIEAIKEYLKLDNQTIV